MKDFADMFPKRFNNKTNGVTPRRWLWVANPPLAELITQAIGGAWVRDAGQLDRLRPQADDTAFLERFTRVKRETKLHCAAWLNAKFGLALDPDTIFDCHIKRIHEYKRQLLNALRIVVFYNRLRDNPLRHAGAHRLLHALGGLELLSRGRSARARSVRGPARLGAHGRIECSLFGSVLERPGDCRIRERDLGGDGVPDTVAASIMQATDLLSAGVVGTILADHFEASP